MGISPVFPFRETRGLFSTSPGGLEEQCGGLHIHIILILNKQRQKAIVKR